MAKRRSASSKESNLLKFFLMLSFVVTILFLWGRVQIDFVIQGLDGLKIQKQSLLREIDDLQVQINDLKQYKRIVSLARQQGLVVVEQSKSEKLSVDFSGLDFMGTFEKSGIQVAGLGPIYHMQKEPSISPFQEQEDENAE